MPALTVRGLAPFLPAVTATAPARHRHARAVAAIGHRERRTSGPWRARPPRRRRPSGTRPCAVVTSERTVPLRGDESWHVRSAPRGADDRGLERPPLGLVARDRAPLADLEDAGAVAGGAPQRAPSSAAVSASSPRPASTIEPTGIEAALSSGMNPADAWKGVRGRSPSSVAEADKPAPGSLTKTSPRISFTFAVLPATGVAGGARIPHASPTPSPFASACSPLGAKGQLSVESGTPSPSESGPGVAGSRPSTCVWRASRRACRSGRSSRP